jgi:hypothetical protein
MGSFSSLGNLSKVKAKFKSRVLPKLAPKPKSTVSNQTAAGRRVLEYQAAAEAKAAGR